MISYFRVSHSLLNVAVQEIKNLELKLSPGRANTIFFVGTGGTTVAVVASVAVAVVASVAVAVVASVAVAVVASVAGAVVPSVSAAVSAIAASIIALSSVVVICI
jgi:hypothetical protein